MEHKEGTIGAKIEKEVKVYTGMYETLKRVGNKKPAGVVLTNAWLSEQFVAEQVMKKLEELYKEEAKQEEDK